VVLNPETDIQEDANHVLYSLENYISAAGEQHGICIIPKDTPLAALGNPGIYKYRHDYKAPKEPVIYFNLFNNMWGTNFPQWIGGDLCYRYVLFGFSKEEEALNLEKAAMLKEGAELTGNILTEDICKFPEHMQLMNTRKEKNGIILRFKDLLGEESLRKIAVENYSITPCDLNNRAEGESAQGEYTFTVKPYGIYSFVLSKIECSRKLS
jgi:alpha-mannosidase